MNRDEKLKLIERLVNERQITFSEGLALMETEKEYITLPYIQPVVYPNYPSYPNPPIITCSTNNTRPDNSLPPYMKDFHIIN